MFTKEQIIDESKRILDGSLSSLMSPIYGAWSDMAEEWLQDNAAEYIRDGFKGFVERTPEEIVLDFHINNKLIKPLSETEFDELMSRCLAL